MIMPIIARIMHTIVHIMRMSAHDYAYMRIIVHIMRMRAHP